jgi:hypothetical protein
MCFEDFDSAFALTVKKTKEFIEAKGAPLSSAQEEIYNK